jgi:hypothetical protein
MKIFVPRDAAAKALGAEDVVRALMAEADARGLRSRSCAPARAA